MRRLFASVLAITMALGVLGAVGASTAQADVASTRPARALVGMSSHSFWLSEKDARAELGELAAAGITSVREDLRWDQLEPRRGQFDWTRSDALLAAAAAAGVDVLGILTYSAHWASSDPSGAGDIYYPPTDPADYARFAAAVVARYGPGGSFWSLRPDLRPRPLAAVELWNEPWGHWFWKSGVDPVAYARLAHAAAQAIRSSGSAVKVVVPGDLLQVRTDGAIAPWLDGVLRADPSLPALVDAYSVHAYPYPFTQGPLVDHADARWDFGRVSLIHDVVAARGGSKPLWITELGWSTSSTSDGVSEAAQASFVRDAIVRTQHDWPYVEKLFLYTWTRDGNDPADREAHYGMRRADGSAKPAWDAVRSLLAAGASAPAPSSSSTTTTSSAMPLFVRVAGSDRIATAIAISRRAFGDGAAKGVLLARADDFPDALAATPLAAAQDAPVLVTPSSTLDPRVLVEIRRALAPGETVTILGGSAAVSPEIEGSLRTAGYAVRRLAGGNRFETAAVVASELHPSAVLLATGRDFPDALSAGAVAPALHAAVVLTDGSSLPLATRAFLAANPGIDRIAIGAAAAAAVPGATRVAGRDRYETARLAAELGGAPAAVAIASGTTFSDALTGGADIGRRGGRLVLTPPSHLGTDARQFVDAVGDSASAWFVYGGSAAVADPAAG